MVFISTDKTPSDAREITNVTILKLLQGDSSTFTVAEPTLISIVKQGGKTKYQ